MPSHPVGRSRRGSIAWRDALPLGRRLVAWWLGELAEAVPDPVRAALARLRGSRTTIEVSRTTVRAAHRAGAGLDIDAWGATDPGGLADGLRWAAAAEPTAEPVDLVLDRSLVLTRRLTLPIAAADTLETIVRYQLPRLVPVPAKDLIHVHVVESRDPSAKTMLVRVTMTKRTTIARIVAAAEEAGLTIGRIMVRDQDGSGRSRLRTVWKASAGRFALLRPLAYRYRMASISILLLVLALLLQLARTSVIDHRLATQLAELEQQAAGIKALHGRLSRETEQDAFLRGRMAMPTAADVLAQLTRLLPADVSLTRFSYQMGEITCSGRAQHAAGLISRIERSGRFTTPHFLTATTTAADGTGEAFELGFSAAVPDHAR